MNNEKFINGSDLLVQMDGKATGHSTSHTSTFSTETKDVAFKPVATTPKSSSKLFKNKRITGLSVQIKCEGLCIYGETESGLKAFLAKWKKGASVPVKCFERGGDATPYLSGNFVISSLENTAPAGEDATYSVTFDNDGEVEIDETKLDKAPAGGGESA